MTIKEFVDINYIHAIRRGKISESTTNGDFMLHLQQEFSELLSAKKVGNIDYFNERIKLISDSKSNGYENDINSDLVLRKYKEIMAGTKSDEIADMIFVLFSYSKFLGIDIQKVLEAKLKYNTLRDEKNELSHAKKEPSCLEYLLELLDSGKVFNIYYNSDHCIGVCLTRIYEKDSNAFKKSIENEERIRYFELSKSHSVESIISSFGLSERYQSIIKAYYERKRTEKK